MGDFSIKECLLIKQILTLAKCYSYLPILMGFLKNNKKYSIKSKNKYKGWF